MQIMVQVLCDGTRCELATQEMLRDDLEGVCRTCRRSMGSLVRGNLKNKELQCWSGTKGDKMTWTMLVLGNELNFFGLHREQNSLISLGTTESHSGATMNQRLRRWRGKSHKLVKKEVRLCQSETTSGRKTFQRNHRKARTLKAALEHRIGIRVPPDARILCWLVEFAAYLINRCDIGSDGKTPLLHGRKDTTPILEFEEDLVHASQPIKRRKVGTAIPSWSVC